MKNISKLLVFVFATILVAHPVSATTLAERLGYSPSDKLLILHVDDLGAFTSSTDAARDIFRYGLAQSGSVMTGAPQAAQAIAETASIADLGIHVTLSSEFASYPWKSVATVPSLLDSSGRFVGPIKLAVFGSATDVALEIEAQIKKGLELGLNPTHLDSHEGTVFFRPAWFKTYLNLAKKYRLAPMIPRFSRGPRELFGFWSTLVAPFFNHLIDEAEAAGFLTLDDFYILPPPSRLVSYKERRDQYIDIIKRLQPGVSEIVLHPVYAQGLFARNILAREPAQTFRVAEAAILQDPVISELIRTENIHLISWRDIASVYPWDQVSELK